MFRKSLVWGMVLGIVLVTSSGAFASQYFTNIKEELPYEYSFSQKYIIVGERVLNLTIFNNAAYNIEAIEFEIRLQNAFGDVVSDWSTFTDPDLQIPAHTSKSLTLTLTRRNILGAKIENVLDQARFIDLRYKRILLDDDVLLSQRDLYPEIAYTYGPFRIELDIINNKNIDDLTKHSFYRRVFKEGSIADNIRIIKFHYIGQFVNIFSEDCLILLATITNISEEVQKKDWFSTYKIVFTLTDDKINQYNIPSLGYAFSDWENVVKDYQGLLPNATFFIIYVFDKIDSYTPKKLKVYIDGQEYYKAFLRKNDKYVIDNK